MIEYLEPVTAEEAEALDDEFCFITTAEAFIAVDSHHLDDMFILVVSKSEGFGFKAGWFRLALQHAVPGVRTDAWRLAHQIEDIINEALTDG